MIKTLAKQIKEYKSASLVTPIFMILEVAMEMVIPLLMASIIDDGVQAGDMKHIFAIGCYMILAAIVGLFAGVMGGKYGAKASTGYPYDHGCYQYPERLPDALTYVLPRTGQPDLCYADGVPDQCKSGKYLSGGGSVPWNRYHFYYESSVQVFQ